MRASVIGRLGLLGAIGLFCLVWSAPAPALAQGGADRCACVAVIDLNTVLANLDEKADREAELGKFIGELENRVQSLQQELKDKSADMDVLPKGSLEYEQAQEQYVRLGIRVRTEAELSQALAARKKDRMQLEVFEKIALATAAYCEREGIDLVINNDSNMKLEAPEGGEPTPQQIQAYINRSIIYASDRVDISSAVATAMNAEYHAGLGQGDMP